MAEAFDISIDVTGEEPIIKKFNDRALIEREMERARDRGTTVLFEAVRLYPRPRAGSTYIRTETFFRSVKQRKSRRRSTVIGVISSDLDYAGVLKDTENQIDLHRSLWPNTEADLEKNTDKIIGFFEDAREEIVRVFQ